MDSFCCIRGCDIVSLGLYEASMIFRILPCQLYATKISILFIISLSPLPCLVKWIPGV